MQPQPPQPQPQPQPAHPLITQEAAQLKQLPPLGAVQHPWALAILDVLANLSFTQNRSHCARDQLIVKITKIKIREKNPIFGFLRLI